MKPLWLVILVLPPVYSIYKIPYTVMDKRKKAKKLIKFYIYGSVPRWSILIIVQRDATQSSLFIILEVNSTCFGRQPHPSSGVHKTVSTASGTGHIFCAATSFQRGQTKQSIYYSASSLYMFRASTTTIIRSIQNCNYSFRYWPYFFVQLPPSNM